MARRRQIRLLLTAPARIKARLVVLRLVGRVTMVRAITGRGTIAVGMARIIRRSSHRPWH